MAKAKTYSIADIEKLEAQKKALASKIANAKRQIAKKKALEERKRRDHQMFTFGGEIERVYEEVYGEKLFTVTNEEKLAHIVTSLSKYFKNLKSNKK